MLGFASTLLPVGLLALMVEAGPIAQQHRSAPEPISIPLTRRAGRDTTSPDGSIDWMRAHVCAREAWPS